jgi:tRNA dimethylallyltransferase
MKRLAVEVLAIFGPTGTGKTVIAESVADAIASEVVSADAMQVYRGLPILTNQPERPTRLVAIRELAEEMSVGEYAPLAHAAIDELVADRGSAVVAGGAGLYFRAALSELGVPSRPEPGVRERWEDVYDRDPARAYGELRARDPAAATLVHANDRKRVVRALELAEAGGSLVPGANRLWGSETRRPTLVFGLVVSRARLQQRIERRTAAMFEREVVAEVRRALASGPVSRTATSALGLREVAELPADEAKAAIVRRTLRYAAYQRKWMRRIPGVVMIDAEPPPDEVANAILEVARAR